MEKITKYGPILIRKGPYKGKIGYYDDTDMDGKLNHLSQCADLL